MKKTIYILMLAFLFLIGCTRNPTDPDGPQKQNGGISFSMDMKKAPSQVVSITGYLTRMNFDTTFLDFEINGDTAYCQVNNLTIGNWTLTVNAMDANGAIWYTGGTAVEIVPGFITPINLTLNPTTGGISISVTWGQNSSELSFGNVTTLALGAKPYTITKTDIDQDGDLDLLIPNYQGHSISILNNDGDGNFTENQRLFAGYHPTKIIAENFDNEWALELAVSNYDLNYEGITLLSLTPNTNEYEVTDSLETTAEPHSMCARDFDEDGDIDLAVSYLNIGKISIFKNNGIGDFSHYSTLTFGDMPCWIESGDFDSDGDNDLVIAEVTSGTLRILSNDGDGNFLTNETHSLGSEPWQGAVSDIDGDQDLDIVIPLRLANQIKIYRNNGDATFDHNGTYSTGNRPIMLDLGDLDNDDDNDIVITSVNSGDLYCYLNYGNGEFALDLVYSIGPELMGVAVGDWDGNSTADIAVTNGLLNEVYILFNQVNQ